MKRELKGCGDKPGFLLLKCFTHHPDEEGTESPVACALAQAAIGFTHHPDEEGTESLKRVGWRHALEWASHTIPMKRELKASRSGLSLKASSALHTPSR